VTKDSWNPQQYEKFKNERSQPFFDLMGLLEPAPEARVIDLGCGTGELTADLHRHLQASHTQGLDSSAQMLERASAFEGQGLSFDQGDIKTWEEKGSYDIIFSNAALQWCGNHHELFRRIKKSLKPSGQLAVQMPMNYDYPTHVLAVQMGQEEQWASLMKDDRYEQQKAMLTPEEYATMLFKLGFKEQKVFVRVYGHVLESREGVVEWVKGTLLTYFESRMTQENFAGFQAEFKQRLFAQLPNDKPFFYPFKRILMWARA
jgi:trans-aconitate 2-methyltransferase